MLRINHRTSVKNAKGYFDRVLAKDYYGKENPGLWHGKGAEILGLDRDSPVTREQFHWLCENRHPMTGKRLNVRDPKRVYYDFTFSVPKSVSIAYFYYQDQRILDAFENATRQVIDEMQATDMQTRVRKDGQNFDRNTGNVTAALFTEFTTRPVDGVPDMHLHQHGVFFNTTWDAEEERHKAGQFVKIKQNAPYYQARFEAEVARELTGIGYGVRRTAKGWELNRVPDSVIEKFSRRTQEIEKLADDLHITAPETKAKLGSTSRSNKSYVPEEELQPLWWERLTDEEKAVLDGNERQGLTPPTVAQSLDYAMEYAFERNSVVTKRGLIKVALQYGVGYVTPEELHQGLEERTASKEVLQKVRGGEVYLTTAEVLLEEREMIAMAFQGRGKHAALNLSEFRFDPIISPSGEEHELNFQQKAAVHRILNSNDLVTLVRGSAGVGKTELLKQAARGIREGGHEVFAFAPSAGASRGVLREAGFASAETVHQLLNSRKIQEQARDNVILVDEAGLMGVRQLNRVLSLAKELNARVILSGDSNQHRPVERGDGLRILETHAGIEAAEVTEIIRQRGAYRKAVEALSHGDTETGYRRLDRMGAIIELSDEERYEQLATGYLKATGCRKWFRSNERKTALVVSPTHAEGDRVTEIIRDILKELSERNPRKLGEEHPFTERRNLGWTSAEKKDPWKYQAGQVVQFMTGVEGIKGGSRFTVAGLDERGSVLVKSRGGVMHRLDLSNADSFQVYQERRINLAVGDRLRISQNGFTQDGKHRLNNGDIYDVAGFIKDEKYGVKGIRLSNGWVIDRDYGNLAHGYVTTSHASQGKTVDHVFIAQSAQSFGASDLEQFYVSVSRGKQSVRIYTDDKEALARAVSESGKRIAAVELIREEEALRNQREQQERAKFMEQVAVWARTHAAYLNEGLVAAYGAVAETARRIITPQQEPTLER